MKDITLFTKMDLLESRTTLPVTGTDYTAAVELKTHQEMCDNVEGEIIEDYPEVENFFITSNIIKKGVLVPLLAPFSLLIYL